LALSNWELKGNRWMLTILVILRGRRLSAHLRDSVSIRDAENIEGARFVQRESVFYNRKIRRAEENMGT
jgi:hypothetical protein